MVRGGSFLTEDKLTQLPPRLLSCPQSNRYFCIFIKSSDFTVSKTCVLLQPQYPAPASQPAPNHIPLLSLTSVANHTPLTLAAAVSPFWAFRGGCEMPTQQFQADAHMPEKLPAFSATTVLQACHRRD